MSKSSGIYRMEFLLLLACSVVAMLVTMTLRRRKRRRVASSLGGGASCLPPPPPGPVGYPLLGNLLYVIGPLRHNRHRELASLAETYGPILSLRLGLTRTWVVLSSSAVAHEALIKNDAATAARFVPDNVGALSYAATSIAFLPSSSPLWKQLRVAMGAAFSSSRGLDAIRPILERGARQLAEYLRERGSSGCDGRPAAPVNIREAVNTTVLNVVSNVIFSEDVVDLRAQGQQTFKGLVVPVLQEWSKPSVSDAFPSLAPLVHLLGSRRRISINLTHLYKLFEGIIERRLAATRSDHHHDDLLDVLLSKHVMSKFTRQQLTTFLTDMFITASDTSTVTVQWAMTRLLRHPEKMKKVKAELAAQLGSQDFVTESDLNKLPYLHAVVKETLRLHPSVPLIPREVVADDLILGGFHVPKGTGVVVNLWAIGRDERAWLRPEEFIPERFFTDGQHHQHQLLHYLTGDVEDPAAAAYRPFGAGRRVCPGTDYTVRSVPLLLASILHKIEWSLPGDTKPEDMDLSERYATVLNLATPLHAVPVSSTM